MWLQERCVGRLFAVTVFLILAGKTLACGKLFWPFFLLLFFVDAFGTGVLTFRFVFTVKQTSLSIQAVFQWLA